MHPQYEPPENHPRQRKKTRKKRKRNSQVDAEENRDPISDDREVYEDDDCDEVRYDDEEEGNINGPYDEHEVDEVGEVSGEDPRHLLGVEEQD
ncbi:unnamed protein product [Cochlearia groenlandica]